MNSRHVQLLQILSKQLEFLIDKEKSDLHLLLLLLKKASLLSEEDCKELEVYYTLDTVNTSTLSSEINQLT